MEKTTDKRGFAMVDVTDDNDVHLAVVFDGKGRRAHRLGKGLGIHGLVVRLVGLHEALGAKFLHGIATDVVLGAAGAFAGLGELKFLDDFIDVAG